ncbi:MAG: asparagine synthase [Betaproteobacteria bacterium HGW-Betaproteobacteria-10]|nr:MAG: asparagine synthase [Betaproteobacteria bacterium HGW-Betaproteobacteria-10]
MNTTFIKSNDLFIGNPLFSNPGDAQLTELQGQGAVWSRGIVGKGQSFLSDVTGDFAVGINLPSDGVFLAVDRFAIHSLCYRQVDGRLLFAERADALADDSTEIDPQAIFDYLFAHAIPSPRTIFKGIYRLPPAHCAIFENGKLSVTPYWLAHFEENVPASFGDLRVEFKKLLGDAVAKEVAGYAPEKIGCFLSGGTDSSTVSGMVGQATGKPAETYSIGFEADGYDEMEFARIAARHFKTNHHEYYVTPDDLVRSIADVAAYYDQPFGNSSALPAYYCARVAKENGIEKMLAGDGGDELFGGNLRYAKQRIFDLYSYLPQGVRSGVIEPLFERGILGSLPIGRKAKSYIEQARVPMPDRTHMYNLLLRLGVSNVLTPDFLRLVDPEAVARQQREVWQQANAKAAINQTLAFEWRYTLAESDLPKVCGTTKLAGVAVGFPMLDQKLVDFSAKLPPDYKLKGFKLRWFFKEALRGFLPDEILTKKKQGFGLPFGVWMTRHIKLRELAVNSLQSLAGRGIVKRDFIDDLLGTRLTEHPGYYGEMVWILMMLEEWLKAHRPTYRLA